MFGPAHQFLLLLDPWQMTCQKDAFALPLTYKLRTASSRVDYESFARLAIDYHAWLNVDLCFQNFEQELASLPGCYAQPTGCIFLVSYTKCATPNSQDIACVAIRPLRQLPTDNSGSSACRNTADEGVSDATARQLPCIADACELKRLWVAPAHQQSGLGHALMQAALQAAKHMGYSHMVLDTLDTLTAANRLYNKLGFARTDPYYHNPLSGVVYWRKDLRAA